MWSVWNLLLNNWTAVVIQTQRVRSKKRTSNILNKLKWQQPETSGSYIIYYHDDKKHWCHHCKLHAVRTDPHTETRGPNLLQPSPTYLISWSDFCRKIIMSEVTSQYPRGFPINSYTLGRRLQKLLAASVFKNTSEEANCFSCIYENINK